MDLPWAIELPPWGIVSAPETVAQPGSPIFASLTWEISFTLPTREKKTQQ